MKLKRLAINRLPGIGQPFEIEAVESGFHIVFGPNGIGKSSICRAIEALYWEDRGPTRLISVNGEFESDGQSWWGEREGARLRWQRDGEGSGPPNLPPSHNHRCFFLRLRDLIDPSRDGTQDIASEIQRQMSGGFDLDEIAAGLFTGVTTHRSRRERDDFRKAERAVQDAEGKQAGLQRRSDELATLGMQLEEAEASTRRLVSVERALGLAGRLEEHVGIAEEIEALPGALTRLSGKEAVEIERLQEQVDAFAKRAQSLKEQLTDASEARKKSGLAAPLDQVELAVWRNNADKLGHVELALEAARTERNASRRELAAALSAIGGDDVADVGLTLPKHGQLFEFLRASEAHKAKAAAILERLRLLERVERLGDGYEDLGKFRDAAEALRSWLRVPQPETLSARVRARWPWFLFAFAMAAAGAGLAMLIHLLFALISAVGAGIALPALFLRDQGVSSTRRNAARAAFENLDVEEPAAWDIPSVESRLRGFESQIADLEAASQRARDRDVEWQKLKAEEEGISKEEAALDARRQTLADALNLSVLPPDAELVDFARSLDQLRLARSKDEAVAGKMDDLDKRYTRLLTDLAGILERYGEPRPTDSATARARLNNLAGRNSQLVQAISAEQQAADQLEHVSDNHNATLGSIRKVYSEAALDEGDLHGLVALLNSLPRYLNLKSDKERLESKIELDRTELVRAGEDGLGEYDRLSLEQLKGELSIAAAKEAELRDKISGIKIEVNEARRGGNVQNLLAAREEARAKLRDCRDEALFAKAGRFLIDAVEEEYEQTQMPRVFERARDHFSAFTHHGYELRLGKAAGAPRLLAVDLRSGEGQELEELSDGTRAQLLLAARIAFAEEVEQGKILPLFLDEALDQSDPERFEAIVRSLGRVANDHGRQIFYLTSDPLDVDRIQHALGKDDCGIAASIDLGLIRTNAASVSGPHALRVGQRPTVPAPDGLSAEEYGATLNVPVFRPGYGYAEQHFFYVLTDALDLLHYFLVNGIERAGQWKTILGTPLADRLGSRAISAPEIGLRLDLLEVFCELWKHGRGRSADRDVLEDSGALSGRFLDDVVVIAQELDGDPERLLAALETRKDPRLKGFRQNSLEGLERYLRENGYLSDRSVLTEEELRLHALASPAANELPEGVARGCLDRWWAWAVRLSELGL